MATIFRLNALSVASISEPGRHADGGNLYLNVSKSGSKSWVFMYRHAGRTREMGLGPAGPGGLSLQQARQKAAEHRAAVLDGGDPLAAKKARKVADKAAQAAAVTFGECADEFIALHENEWRNAKHRAQWRSTMSDNYIRDLRRRPVSEITTEDVLAVLKPLWKDKRETGSRIRQRIETVLDAATVEGRRSGPNPAAWGGHLDKVLPPHGKASKGHHAAMPWDRLPKFMAELELREGIAARALEFLILTAARSGEVRGARWHELDLDGRVWRVPAERMKAGREHRVPLSARAVAVVETMLPLRPRLDPDNALVFPGLRRAPLSDMTLGAVLKRMSVTDATVHGFRSAFRTWAGEMTATPFEVMEAALAHAIADATVAAYARTDLFEKRRKLMEDWEAFLSTPPAQKTEAA